MESATVHIHEGELGIQRSWAGGEVHFWYFCRAREPAGQECSGGGHSLTLPVPVCTQLLLLAPHLPIPGSIPPHPQPGSSICPIAAAPGIAELGWGRGAPPWPLCPVLWGQQPARALSPLLEGDTSTAALCQEIWSSQARSKHWSLAWALSGRGEPPPSPVAQSSAGAARLCSTILRGMEKVTPSD